MSTTQNAPDWIDIEALCRAISAMHGCTTQVIISPDGLGATGGLHVTLLSTFPVLPGAERGAEAQLDSVWPCRECRSLEIHVFKGLYNLDYKIGQLYQSGPMFK